MKLARIAAAAGLIVATLGVSGTATAQHRGDRHGYSHNDRRDHRYENRGRHYGWNRHHQRCRVEWRGHRQVRICR